MSERIYELRLTPAETILARLLTRGTTATEEALLNYVCSWLDRVGPQAQEKPGRR